MAKVYFEGLKSIPLVLENDDNGVKIEGDYKDLPRRSFYDIMQNLDKVQILNFINKKEAKEAAKEAIKELDSMRKGTLYNYSSFETTVQSSLSKGTDASLDTWFHEIAESYLKEIKKTFNSVYERLGYSAKYLWELCEAGRFDDIDNGPLPHFQQILTGDSRGINHEGIKGRFKYASHNVKLSLIKTVEHFYANNRSKHVFSSGLMKF